jgi:hypothetical protein
VIVALGGPVGAYLRLHVITPTLSLGVIIIVWLSIGLAGGTLQDLFGLAFYAAWFSPLYIAVYLLTGGIEFYKQKYL